MLYIPIKFVNAGSSIKLNDGTILRYNCMRMGDFLGKRNSFDLTQLIPSEIQKNSVLLQKIFELIHEKRFRYNKLNTKKDEFDLLFELIEIYKVSKEIGLVGLLPHFSFTTFRVVNGNIQIISKKRRYNCNIVTQFQLNYELCIEIINKFECINKHNLHMLPDFVRKYVEFPVSDDFMKTIKCCHKNDVQLYHFIVDNVVNKFLIKYNRDYPNNNGRAIMYDYLNYVLSNDLSITITQLKHSIEIIYRSLGSNNKTSQILISNFIMSGTEFIEYLTKSNIDLCEFNYFNISSDKWFEMISEIIKSRNYSYADFLTSVLLGANDFGGKKTVEIMMKICLEKDFKFSKYSVLGYFHYSQKFFSPTFEIQPNINDNFSLVDFENKLMNCLCTFDQYGEIDVNEFKIDCTSLKDRIIFLFMQNRMKTY